MIVDLVLIQKIMKSPELLQLVPAIARTVRKGCCNAPAKIDMLLAKQVLSGYPEATVLKLKAALGTSELVFNLPTPSGVKTVTR